MKIYTKTGDGGETSVGGGKRVSKADLKIECYGTIDELNCTLGICRTNCGRNDALVAKILLDLQNDLFALGSDLAFGSIKKVGGKDVPRIGESDIAKLEKWIDEIEEQLEPLANFILPSGSQLAAILHLARAICRRAERLVVKMANEEVVDKNIIVYLNRLSDLLFVMARLANKSAGEDEEKWISSEN